MTFWQELSSTIYIKGDKTKAKPLHTYISMALNYK